MITAASRRRRRYRVLAVFVAMLSAAAVGAPVAAAADVSFGAPRAMAAYGTGITFSQPLTPVDGIKRIEVLVTTPGAIGPLAVEVPRPACCQPTTLTYALTETDGHIVPNTRFKARWRVTRADGTTSLGPEVSVLYSDTRFDWKTETGPIVRVHWYQGSDGFGKRALAIGEKGIDSAARLLGVTETEPVDFYIYADQDAFYDALGPGTRENVGGEAHADIRTMFALIRPDEIDATWVSTVVPHELTHLVFDTAVKNPYHFPPRWLNEGLAVYLSEGYGDSWRSAVRNAVDAREIIPLDGLTGQFPTTRDQFFLAYGESVSAVDYLVRKFGQDKLVKLVRSYADGVTDDEAFQAGIGLTVAAFQAGWLADLGVAAPAVIGPRPGPPGPLPPGWTEPAGVPAASGAPFPGSPAGPAAPGENGSGLLVIGALVLGVVLAVSILLVTRSRRRPTGIGW
jgi:hypothetical protein